MAKNSTIPTHCTQVPQSPKRALSQLLHALQRRAAQQRVPERVQSRARRTARSRRWTSQDLHRDRCSRCSGPSEWLRRSYRRVPIFWGRRRGSRRGMSIHSWSCSSSGCSTKCAERGRIRGTRLLCGGWRWRRVRPGRGIVRWIPVYHVQGCFSNSHALEAWTYCGPFRKGLTQSNKAH